MDRSADLPGAKRPGRRVGRILAWVVLVAACGGPTEPRLTKWEGSLVAVPPSAITGQVAAVSQFGRTEISLLLEDAEVGTPHGWRVDSGDCQENGLIQGGSAQYPLLVPAEGGTGSAHTAVPGMFDPDGEYAARVFVTGEGGSEQILACGELHPVQ